MLNIITGRTGSGKTRYIRNFAAEIANNEKGKAVIIVPEQFSFETEKGMLQILGNEKINNVEILSFSRIAEKLLSDYGKITKKVADNATRAVVMSMAIESLQDKLTYYKKYQKNPLLISQLLDLNTELKNCCVPVTQLAEISEKVNKPIFAKKLNELSLIFQCYDSILSKNFQDDSLKLDLLAELLLDVDYFKGKTVFLDAFEGFSAQIYKILERIFATADDVYVTFCCDTERNNQEYELFYNAICEIRKVRDAANRANVKIAPIKTLYPAKEYKADSLNFLEDNLFEINGKKYDKNCDNIALVPCVNKVDECDFVASEIKRLVREENYRYRDIAVIERGADVYKNQLLSSFRKYGIDCFPDNRQPILTQPLMVFMLSLFDMLGDGFYTENVLRFLKTGLYGFSIEEISLIEDYTLMWQIKPSEWKNEWNGNPDGFGTELNEFSAAKLKTINDLRAKIVGPVVALKNRITDTDGETISKELFTFLKNTKVDENLKAFTKLLNDNGEEDLAVEQGRIWKILTEILDNLCSAVNKNTIALKRYRELFEIIVSTKDLGQIPNGIDEVIIGSANRIKASAPKAVFIVGANAGVFPMISTGGAVLTDIERCELQSKGVEIISNLEFNSVSERFIAYHAMTMATEKLYVSYSSSDTSADTLTPSELVIEIQRLYEDKIKTIKPDSISKIESRKTAYSVLASEKNKNTILGSTLYNYFENRGSQKELSMLQKTEKREFEIKDSDLATELFGKSMYISASKTEKFYKCPFGYFCEFGIKAQPRREAQMDPAQTGTLIHELLEKFLKETPKDQLGKLEVSEIRQRINRIIDDYVEEKLSGYNDKTKAFIRTINLLKDNSFKIIMQLVDEFANCDFVPVNFELNINNDGDIDPYLIELPNGGTVKIIGKVDRVDAYKTEYNTFIRIVDYKTGSKTFDLGEVLEGLNMQMLIYLFAIWQNGGKLYENVTPAGILYFQAKPKRVSEDRYASDDVVESKTKGAFKMSGMVLNNLDVIKAMERDLEGVYIPAGVDKKGNVTGNVISLESLTNLKNKVNDLIKEMASRLQAGDINALPVEDGCKYCSYKDVCKREESDAIRELNTLDFKKAVSMLGGSDDE